MDEIQNPTCQLKGMLFNLGSVAILFENLPKVKMRCGTRIRSQVLGRHNKMAQTKAKQPAIASRDLRKRHQYSHLSLHVPYLRALLFYNAAIKCSHQPKSKVVSIVKNTTKS